MGSPSCCVLVKNEAYWLPFTLKQTLGHFDSYVIYDVGSTDNTRDIIDWFVEEVGDRAEMFVRYLPDCDPKIQGTFRNSMIAEGRRDSYFILDGDELYKQDDLAKISGFAEDLESKHAENIKKRFGVLQRVEMSTDLTQQYDRRRSHHRIYTRDAFWHGTHPGEVSGHKQNDKSEVYYDAVCWHLHNALRSPAEEDVQKRVQRKSKKTYHPGNLIPMDLLSEVPILRERIESFPVSPALEKLWAK